MLGMKWALFDMVEDVRAERVLTFKVQQLSDHHSCVCVSPGMSSWRCAGQSWASPSPDLSECVSPWLSALDKQVTNMVSMKGPALLLNLS